MVFWLHFSVKLIASVLNFCIFTFHFNIKIKSFILKLNFLLLLFIMSASPFTLWQNGEKKKFFVKFCHGSVLKFPDVLWSYGWKIHNQTEQNEIFGQQNVKIYCRQFIHSIFDEFDYASLYICWWRQKNMQWMRLTKKLNKHVHSLWNLRITSKKLIVANLIWQ